MNELSTTIDFSQICSLSALLSICGIPHELTRIYDGYKVTLYDENKMYLNDAICHSFSYGGKDGLLEIFTEDDVEGYLTAEEVGERWNREYDLKLWRD